MNLTPRQLDVLVAIRDYRYLNGVSPTMQELADQLGTSKVTIFEHVGALEKKGLLKRDKHKARSLEITSDDPLPDEERSTKLPLLGAIAAGSPIDAVENREELDLEQLGRAAPPGKGPAPGAQSLACCRVLEQDVQNVVARSTPRCEAPHRPGGVVRRGCRIDQARMASNQAVPASR